MATDAVTLPEGFTLDAPSGKGAQLPEGFTLDAPQAAQEAPEMSYPERALTGAAMFAGGLTRPGALADVGVNMLRQAVAYPVSGLAGIAGAVLPGKEGQGAEWVRKTQETLGGQPMTLGGRAAVTGLGAQMEPAVQVARAPGSYVAEQGVPALGIKPSEATRVAGAVLSGVPEAALGAVGMRSAVEGLVSGVKTAAGAYKAASERFGTPARPSPFTLSETPGWGTPPQQPPAPATTPRPSSPTQPSGGFGATSVGAAQTPLPVVYQQALQNSSPQLQRMVSTLPADQLNPTALDRHIQADSLGIQLTEGQGTGDAVKISRERNMRGANPELVQRFNDQNERLKELLPELREQLTPTATIPDTTASGEGLIAAYQRLEDLRVEGIKAAYRRLIAMNNGVFPIDQQTMLQNARARLSQNLKSEFLPDSIDLQMKMFEQGQPMNFEQFEALRTNLSNVMRGTDGNATAAARIVRESMEELPLLQTASPAGQQYALEIKSTADEARSLAKQRFDDLDTDKAYASVVNGNARMNTFIRKFVINAAPEDLRQLALKFGDNLGSEVIRAGVLNHLQDVSISSGTFRQSAFNKALRQLEANRTLSLLFGEEGADRLRTIGNVAQFTQEQPVGSFVNNSNSTTAAIAMYGVNGLAKAIDGITRIPIASTIVDKAVSTYETGKALEPFAGLKK